MYFTIFRITILLGNRIVYSIYLIYLLIELASPYAQSVSGSNI